MVVASGAVWYEPMLPEAAGGWHANGPVRTYDRAHIFDYIDGAGELYLAYDFRDVAVRDYEKPGAPKITADIYRMSTSRDAYGVYSHERPVNEAPDRSLAGIGQERDYGAGLLRFWKGKYFVRVLADRETPESRAAVLAIGKHVSKAITETGSPPDLIKPVPSRGLIARSVRYFHKHTVLNFHYYLSDANILDLGEKTEAVLAQYKLDAGKPRLLIVRYPTAKAASAAFAKFTRAYFKDRPPSAAPVRIEQIEHGQYVAAKHDGRSIELVFEASTREQARMMLRR
jgi:hypothetical protein